MRREQRYRKANEMSANDKVRLAKVSLDRARWATMSRIMLAGSGIPPKRVSDAISVEEFLAIEEPK